MAVIQRPVGNTPEGLLNDWPCLACLSESDLKRVLLYLWLYLFSLENNWQQGLASTTCFKCMSKHQLLEAMVASMADAVLGGDVTAASVAEIVKCMKCVEPARIDGLIVYLWSSFWSTRLPN